MSSRKVLIINVLHIGLVFSDRWSCGEYARGDCEILVAMTNFARTNGRPSSVLTLTFGDSLDNILLSQIVKVEINWYSSALCVIETTVQRYSSKKTRNRSVLAHWP